MQPLRSRLLGLFLAVLFAFAAISFASYSAVDGPARLAHPVPVRVQNLCGPCGAYLAGGLYHLFGFAALFLFLPLGNETIRLLRGLPVNQSFIKPTGICLALTGLAGLLTLYAMPLANLADQMSGIVRIPSVSSFGFGGLLGATCATLLNHFVALAGSTILLTSLLVAGLVLSVDTIIVGIFDGVKTVFALVFSLVFSQSEEVVTERRVEKTAVAPRAPIAAQKSSVTRRAKMASDDDDESAYDEEFDLADEIEAAPQPKSPPQKSPPQKRTLSSWLGISSKAIEPMSDPEEEYEEETALEDETDGYESRSGYGAIYSDYELPSLELLVPSDENKEEISAETLNERARQLEQALKDFKVNVRVVDVQVGPVISQYEIQLAKGLRVCKVNGATDDLAISLAVPSVRVVAPIPGKNSVGIEIPNEKRQTVRIRDVIDLSDDEAGMYGIPVFLGKDVAGAPMIIDLTQLPHLLIAGRTGTGKSVCLNSIIVSMLMTRSPEEVRMIMIDPKTVEMCQYQSIPHLMHPVVTDMRKAEAILAWVVNKMEERYQLLASASVKHLKEYNQLSEQELRRRMKMQDCTDEEWMAVPKKIPYIVVVVDEMNDLMMTAGKEVESHIIRLAQKSRAIGIHLVLATQKPTVNVITGLIKSNLPARIAFGVTSRIDSLVVLDHVGAERLLGDGDMLFLHPRTGQIIRGQGTYVSDGEITAIVESIGVGENEHDFVEELVELDPDADNEEEMFAPARGSSKSVGKGRGSSPGGKGKDADEEVQRDDLYYEAVEYIIQEGRGSLSLLQRRFSIGYGRAARMIDFMAEDGVVGSHNGSQPRNVLLSLSEWRRKRKAALAGQPSIPDTVEPKIRTIKGPQEPPDGSRRSQEPPDGSRRSQEPPDGSRRPLRHLKPERKPLRQLEPLESKRRKLTVSASAKQAAKNRYTYEEEYEPEYESEYEEDFEEEYNEYEEFDEYDDTEEYEEYDDTN